MRVVLKNLPKTVTEEEIRKDFAAKGVPTDARLLTSATGDTRRVAFVGYKTEEEAEKSIVYYNKSYYKGNRLIMEMVRKREINRESSYDYIEKKRKALELSGIGVPEMKEVVKHLFKQKETMWSSTPEEEEKEEKKEVDSVEETIRKCREKIQEENKKKVLETGEIFITGLSYTATEDEIENEFKKYGPISEVYMKHKEKENSWGEGSTLNCGHAIITYTFPKDAYEVLDKEIVFQGRNIKVAPAKERSKQNENKPRENAASKYSAMFFNFTTILGVASKEKRVSKAHILKDTGRGVGGRIALLESELVEKTKHFLIENGISEMCKCKKHPCICTFTSKKSLLVRNIPYGTTEAEIKRCFPQLTRSVFSPSKTLVVLEYVTKSDAANDLKKSNFAKIRDHPVYVDYLRVTKERYMKEASGTFNPVPIPKEEKKKDIHSSKVILKNIPFQAGYPEVSEIIDGLIGKKKYHLRMPKKPDGTHRGFCFVEPENAEDVDTLIEKITHLHLYGRHIVAEKAKL